MCLVPSLVLVMGWGRAKDERNVINGLGEIMKLALVRSTELFDLLEEHGARLVEERFQVNL